MADVLKFKRPPKKPAPPGKPSIVGAVVVGAVAIGLLVAVTFLTGGRLG